MKHLTATGRKGFTLIELLIVVAIIAILAAIAVPNFLEAQTRAKISRTKADMRTIATALESYAIDHNRYIIGLDETDVIDPPSWGLMPPVTAETNRMVQMKRYSYLTTPIAYMTSIPEDPFKRQSDAFLFVAAYRWYQFRSFIGWDIEKHPAAAHKAFNRQARANGYSWHMFSWGPWGFTTVRPFLTYGGNFSVAADLAGATNAIYDPSNGTMSVGLLIRTNKGIYERAGQ